MLPIERTVAQGSFRWLLGVVGLAGAFWVLVLLIGRFDWTYGPQRGLLVGLALLATPAMMHLAARRTAYHPAGFISVLLMVCLVGATGHTIYFFQQLHARDLTDIATTTLAAGDALLVGHNPYRSLIDPQPAPFQEHATYSGYKYLPLMALIYAPLGSTWREQGLLATNLLLDGITTLLIGLVGTRAAGRAAGVFAMSLYLLLPLVPLELFRFGVTDLAALVPILIALLCLDRRPGLAGFWLGLSLSTKLLPALALVLCCVPPNGRRRYIAGLAVGLGPALLFFALSPEAFWSNIVLFNLDRPIDPTHWLYGQSASLSWIVRCATAALLLVVGVEVWRTPPSLLDRCGFAVMCILSTILSGPVSHRNYQLWWIPLGVVLVAAAVLGCGARPAQACQTRCSTNIL